MSILIRNARIIDPKSGRDESADILIAGNMIERIDRGIPAGSADVIDAKGRIVAPGLIDAHAHFREPGFEYKETIRTGTTAAARGGFTTVVCMANTNPVNDNRSITEYIIEKAHQEGIVRTFPCGAITKGLKGTELAGIGDMYEAGIVAISDDGKSVRNAEVLRKAFEYATLFGIPAISHCEDEDLATGYVHEGSASVISGLDATPAIAEEIIVQRDIAVARYVDAPIHITHISTRGSVEIIRGEKQRFSALSCDTCPHYFTLADEATLGFDTNTKVNPPLRSREDIEAIKEGLRDGTVDIIATDHAPHDGPSKDVEFNLASNGISGLETAFALSLALVREGVLTLRELLGKMTWRPARLFGLPYGELDVGKTADLILFDPDLEWTVDKTTFCSKGKNTPFHGMRLRGKNLLTIVNGQIVFSDPDL